MIKGSYRVSISLCGDLFISRRLPKDEREGGLRAIRDLFGKHDCVFGNLEVPVLRKNEGYPSLFPGGSYGMASPGCLRDLKGLGFNLFNAATNHAMDYEHNGLLKTLEYLEQVDIPVAGIGRNLSEASSPAFCECSGGRVALLGVTSSFHDSHAAGPQNQDMIGRPGVSPLRHKAIYELAEADYESLQRIARETGINAYQNAGIKLGYVIASDNFKFGSLEFKKGEGSSCHTYPQQNDLDRMLGQIRDARIQADVVIMSIHSHQVNPVDKSHNAEFVEIFARKCIEEGADIIACHGPHRMRGIEKYKHGLIFHGLGNMIFQTDQQPVVPEEFYNKYGASRQTSDGVGSVNLARSKNNTRGFITSRPEWCSVIVSMECTGDLFDVTFYPVEISKQTGLPSLSSDVTILQDLRDLSIGYGTTIEIEDGVGRLRMLRTEHS